MKPIKKEKNQDSLKEPIPIARQLPEPSGYRILIALPEADEKTEGGIIKTTALLEQESTGSICGFVMKLGPDAYQDKGRFPNGPYCKEGDWILMRSYTGTRFLVHNKEFRLINDDSIEAVVEDPRGIVKA
jgi:co-chaperonin GroES (HSP10)|tara:strand:- start:1596 stop:1985 length:390 start_codon:yes stop_codon:yes gene_type:complete